MPLLETRNLTAFYGDFQALYGVDTTLDRGETIAIIGANGAGKSTFLKSIAGLIQGAADSVVFDGAPETLTDAVARDIYGLEAGEVLDTAPQVPGADAIPGVREAAAA